MPGTVSERASYLVLMESLLRLYFTGRETAFCNCATKWSNPDTSTVPHYTEEGKSVEGVGWVFIPNFLARLALFWK